MKKMSFHIPHTSFLLPPSSFLVMLLLLLTSCASRKQTADGRQSAAYPVFSADSAYAFCVAQCGFGPRTMNSKAHDACGEWIVRKFESYGLFVTRQKADLKGYDGTILRAMNIVASFRPELSDRILICAHWDSRPWADNDPDPDKHTVNVLGANDGASGVAVMLELARLLSLQSTADSLQTTADSLQTMTSSTDASSENGKLATINPQIGIDFICFDAEDWGTPQWCDTDYSGDSWALGSKYWAAHPHVKNYKARYGILLDMVGGEGAHFFQEAMSLQYARKIVDKVWRAAQKIGYGSLFPKQQGGYITDDHLPINTVAKIPCIDIIPYYPDCQQSSFGPTWHTVSDDMNHISLNTLHAVGQTLVQVLYSE